MKVKGILLLMFSVVALSGFADFPKLPVFFLRYNGAIGQEEDEFEDELEAAAQRHTVSLRIKEELSNIFTTNLLTVYSRKEYFNQNGSYNYYYIYPDFTWKMSDTIRWTNGIKVKWYFFDELDADDEIKDFTSILYNTKFTLELTDAFTLSPLAQALYEFYVNEEKSRQNYCLGVSLEYDLGDVVLTGSYKTTLRWPLTTETLVQKRVDHEFGVGLVWDPNK
jgi:hypothetical protein